MAKHCECAQFKNPLLTITPAAIYQCRHCHSPLHFDTQKWVEDILAPYQHRQSWRCFRCHHLITHTHQAIEINGQHQHHFVNPAGFAYHIGCFHTAAGCQLSGTPTLDASWFAGCYWNFASCQGCQQHLGWFYQGHSEFYGLILKYLIIDNESSRQ